VVDGGVEDEGVEVDIEEQTIETPEPTTQRVEEDWVDNNVTVLEDEFKHITWELEESWEIEYEFIVRDGPAVDVFIVADSEFEHFRQGERFKYYGETLDSGGGSDTVTLEPGSYHMVIDNSELVKAQPPSNLDDDPAEVEIQATRRGT